MAHFELARRPKTPASPIKKNRPLNSDSNIKVVRTRNIGSINKDTFLPKVITSHNKINGNDDANAL